jgi:GTP cyclohydrolase II
MSRLNGHLRRSFLGINGDPAALAVDRAVAELRRGRAIAVADGPTNLVVAALETAQAPLLERLVAGTRVALLLTPERADAAGLGNASGRPVMIGVSDAQQLDELKTVAGMGPTPAGLTSQFEFAPWPGSAGLVAQAFRLAKVGRLVPALVGFETRETVDASVVRIAAAAVSRHAGLVPHGLQRTSQSRVALAGAEESGLVLFRDEHGLGEHVAVVIGTPDLGGVVPVRLHSACLTGDLLGSLRCDCGEQLRSAVRRIAGLGGGVLLYLDQEGRGIGLANKLRAYAIQDTGLDTVDADRHLGFHADERNYDVAAALLEDLGIKRVRLLTNNPEKIAALRGHGIDVVGRVPLVAPANVHNERYLRAKRERAGHLAEESNG